MGIDLHVHSTFSDGSMTPRELVQLASRKGLTALSITDHDNVDAVPELVAAGEEFSLATLPGVELSLVHEGVMLHMLGYLFDPLHSGLQDFLTNIQSARVERNIKIVERIEEQGIQFSEKERQFFVEDSGVGRPHFARLLVKSGLVRSIQDAFTNYLTPGKPCYVERREVACRQAIEILHEAGGVAVLAHPFQMKRGERDLFELIAELASHGLDGLEAYYPTHSKKGRRQLLECAERCELIHTGGSDYHGTFRAGTRLAGGKNVSVPAEVLSPLYARQKRYIR